MKASSKIVISALIVLGMFAGLASAETPDACDPADYGGDWSCATPFPLPNNQYAFVDGVLTSNPVDSVDMWKSNDPNVGDTLLVYLDYDAFDNGLAAELFDGNRYLMQRVKKYDSVENDRTLNAKPAYVKVSGFPGNYAYTFALSRNV
ncbi:MAG: hypothetical protein L6282_05400 [Candidatus Methanoperedenaceae archaeon]|nr:hypothetical protein [Candidatus Methanoperedenaceae archaeon]